MPERYGIPIAVAGFEPLDILRGIGMLVSQAEKGEPRVDNAYPRGVVAEGNPRALKILNQVFELCDQEWRGLGIIPRSGLRLREEFEGHDASKAFQVCVSPASDPAGCRCGEVLRGLVSPPGCPLFRRVCSPENPVGPCMVSGEGACVAYYRFGEGRFET